MEEAHKSVWIFYGVFEVVSLKILQIKDIKKTAELLLFNCACHLAKNFGKMIYLRKNKASYTRRYVDKLSWTRTVKIFGIIYHL